MHLELLVDSNCKCVLCNYMSGVANAAITKFFLCLLLFIFTLFNSSVISLKIEYRLGRRDSSFKPRKFRTNRDVW